MSQELLLNDFYQNIGSISKDEVLARFRQAAEAEIAQNNGSDKYQRLYEAAQQNPEYMTKLYNIREATRNDRNSKTVADIQLDNEGNTYAKITKGMAGGFFDFSIHDGKVVFNGQMDDAKMAEALDFLFRRGITNYELPQGVDSNFAEVFHQQQARREADYQNGINDTIPANNSSISIEQPEIDEKKITPQKLGKEKSDEKETKFQKSLKHIEDWLGEKNQKKVRNLSFFRRDRIPGMGDVYISL